MFTTTHIYFIARVLIDENTSCCKECAMEVKALEEIVAANQKKIKEAKEKYRIVLIENLRLDLKLEAISEGEINDKSV